MWMVGIATAGAATLTVGPAATYTSIQAAIDDADPGDTVRVEPGTYTESLDLLGKELIIRSTAGAADTVLAPPVGLTAVTYEGNDGQLDGFTILCVDARAIDIEDGAPLLRDLIVTSAGDLTLDGGAIRIIGGAPSLRSLTITDAVGQRGGALYIAEDALVDVDDVEIRSSEASLGGAIYMSGSELLGTRLLITEPAATYSGAGIYLDNASLDISGLQIERAQGQWSHGAGIYLHDSELSLEGGEISACSATERALGYDGGAIWLDAGSRAVLSGVDLTDNSARSGGAIASFGGDVVLDDVRLLNNEAITYGGALFASSSALVTSSMSIFDGNSATHGGGTWLVSGAWLSETASRWSSNLASGNGGAIGIDGALAAMFSDTSMLANQSTGSGGAVWATNTAGGLQWVGGVLTDNRSMAGDGGAVAIGDGTPLSLSQVGIERNRSMAGDGGAIAAATIATAADITLSGCVLSANTADRSGGALSIDGGRAVTVQDSSLVDNSAGSDGGALYVVDSMQLHLLRSLVHGNTAADDGGGSFEDASESSSTYENVSFTENSAQHGGAIALWNTAEASVLNSTFAGNRASLDGAHLYVSGSTIHAVNAIFAFAVDGGGVWGDATAEAGSDIFYSLVWANAGGGYVGSFTSPVGISGNIEQEPLFRTFSIDRDESNDDLRLTFGSPAIDQGDPSIVDVDGSRSDIGAWGGPGGFRIDLDGDGVYAHADCDDADPGRSPATSEIPYNSIDEDCDGIDPDDLDGDGFPGGPDGEDCDDLDDAIHPGTTEIFYDGVDQDCDERSDFDRDRDGSDALAFGGGDCNDANASVGPSSAEIWYDGADQDCSGGSDYDQDRDNYDADAWGGEDCDDEDPTSYPDAPERCDGRDNDCDDLIDDAPIDPLPFWRDLDLDGYGDSGEPVFSCLISAGLSADDTDCDDTDDAIHPNAEEVWYDGTDQDCDGIDDDRDRDGFLSGEDCDDLRPEAFPGAPELRNDLDDDCDGWAESDDRDGDALIDWDEWEIGTDAEASDSDDDGLSDGREVPAASTPPDHDSDGIIDPLDDDDDGDFLLTRIEAEIDVDADGAHDEDIDGDSTPNWLDLDTDGDELPDDFEGTRDIDGDKIPDFADYQGPLFGGGCGGCANSRSPGAWWAWLFVALWRRRALAGIVGLGSTAAHAQALEGLDTHGFDVLATSADPRGGLRLAEGGQHEAGAAIGLMAAQANGSLVERKPSGDDLLIRYLTTATAVMSVTPHPRLSFDLTLPTHLYGTGSAGQFTTVGDMRLGAHVSIANRSGSVPGLSLLATTWIPTGDEGRYVGAPDIAGGGLLALSQRIGAMGWTLDLGARLAPPQQRRELSVGSGPLAGLGLHVAASPRLTVFSELTADGALGFSLAAIPVEATAGARTRGPRGRFLTLAAAAGLTDAVGASAWRITVGSGFGPKPRIEPEPEPIYEEIQPPEPEIVPPVIIEVPLAALRDDRIVLREQVFFLEGKAALLPQSDDVLAAVQQVIEEHPEITFLLIEGHTNHNGSASYNYDLSQRRANEVRDWLVLHGIERSRLLTEGFGFDRPLLPPSDPEAALVNRRVEFVVLRSDEASEGVSPARP